MSPLSCGLIRLRGGLRRAVSVAGLSCRRSAASARSRPSRPKTPGRLSRGDAGITARCTLGVGLHACAICAWRYSSPEPLRLQR